MTTDLSGRMFIMAKPSSEHLHEDMRDLRSVGIDLMVSMLEQVNVAVWVESRKKIVLPLLSLL